MNNSNKEIKQTFEVKIPVTYDKPSQYTSSDFEQRLSNLNNSLKRVDFYNTLINLVKELPNDMELGAAVRDYVNKQQDA
jgi:hypothetical protein